jgi:uncharacterized protein (TIGR03435 family)
MNRRKVIIAASVVTGLLVVSALKLLCFPSVKDAYFALNERNLQQVPPGLVVLRRTHYPFLKHADPLYARSPHSRTNFWIVGRNAPLQDLIAVAYDERASRVVVPVDAPKGNFDFLVTVEHPRERLQAAIWKKLGCHAHNEAREVEVLALKVVNPALPNMKLNNSGNHRAHMEGTTVVFVSAPIEGVVRLLSQFYDLSVVDKTGLEGFYDYAIPLPVSARDRMQDDAVLRAAAEATIKDLGLGLETIMEPESVLVVKTKPPAPSVLPDKKWRLLGPLNPGAEEGCEHWSGGESGSGFLLTDNTDPASGKTISLWRTRARTGENRCIGCPSSFRSARQLIDCGQ